MKSSSWCKWISQPGLIRAVTLEATELMRELCKQQALEGVAQQGFADAVLGSLLIASAHKSNESINMNAQGSGPYKQAIVDASPEGRVRGFLIEQKDASMHTFGEKGTNGPWGSGILSVLYTKNFEGKIPYTGMVPISTGVLDEAINDYYRDSEQLVSKIGIDIDFSGTEIRHARGILIQALGGASEEELRDLNSIKVQDLRRLAREMNDVGEVSFATILPDRPFKQIERAPVEVFCNCSQERIERALILTGEKDIVEALAEDPHLEITCDFCRTVYRVSAERVKALFGPERSRLQ